MSLLFAMPNWCAPSEVWLQRMLQMLEPYLDCVVSYKTGGETTWNGHVPAFSLNQDEHPMRERLRTLGLPFPKKNTEYVMQQCVERPGVKKVLCHYGMFATEFNTVWERSRIPLFIHFHGGDATFDVRPHETPDQPVFDTTYLQKLKAVSPWTTYIANSMFTKKLLVDGGLPEEKVVVKYIGVPIPERERHHVEKEDLTILHVGRLIDCKSPDRTIEAFEDACRHGLKAKLIMVGDGPMRVACELLRARSSCRDSIQLLGAVPQEKVKELLSEADIFTQHNIEGELSRQVECYGVAVVEAMAAGVPVVATRNGGVAETVVHEETGFLGTPGDVSEQAGYFLKLAADVQLRQRLGDAGCQRAISHFSDQKERLELLRILRLDQNT